MIGVIAINNTTMPAPLPVDGAISLMVGNTSNDKTYQTLQEITKKDNINMYKSYVNTSGEVDYYNLSEYPKKHFLHKVSANGIIYTSGKLSDQSLKALKTRGITVSANQSYPWFVGGLIQFNGQFRTVVTVILFALAFTGIFIFDARSMRERMIRFAFGKNVININDVLSPVVLIILIGSAMLLCYAVIFGQGFRTLSTQLFMALVMTDIIIFSSMIILSLVIVKFMIHLEKPLNVIKNKAKGKSIFVIWLLLICIMVIAVGKLNEQVQSNKQQLSAQINHLKPWYALKGWQKTQPFDAAQTSENGQLHSSGNSQRDVDLVKKLGSHHYIYMTQSTANIAPFMVGDAKDGFVNQLKRDGITDPDLNQKLWYLNNTAINRQAIDYPSQTYPYHMNKAATIYIPKRYQNKQQSLINTVYVEQLKYYNFSKDDIEIKVIPESQMVFLYNENAVRFSGSVDDLSKSYGSLRNQILVRLNDRLLLEHNAATFANNILNTKGILSPQAIKMISQEQDHLTSSTVEPYQAVILNIKDLKNQLLIANILQVVMFSAVIISVTAYIITIYKFELLTIVKKKMIGTTIITTYIPYLWPLMLTVGIATLVIATFERQKMLAIITFVIIIILEIMTTTIFNQKIRNNYTTLLKGNDI